MAFSIYDTFYMMAALEELPLEQTFFKKRYFPTNENLDVFSNTQVLIDFKTGNRRMADFVMPRMAPISIAREGFSTYTLEPGNIAISRPLTIDQLNGRQFGESLMTNATPEERARYLLMNDMTELSNRISRREELLAVETILNNGATMRHITENPGIYEDVEAKFYDGDDNPALFTPAKQWEHSKQGTDGTWTIGNWYSDIRAMVKMLTQRGLPATELVCSPDVGEFFMCDPWVVAMQDNRRITLGSIDPADLTPFVTNFGRINFGGHMLDIIINENTYEDDTGKIVNCMPEGTLFITSPNCGKGLYGAVTTMDDNGEFQTVAGVRVPERIVDKKSKTRELCLTARPLLVPRRPSPWSVAIDVFKAQD